VADIERSLAFYCGVLGFELMQRYGSQAAFVSAGGYHHHIGLNTWESFGGPPPPPNCTGLFHLAILYPTRAALADALRRLTAANIALDGASDHGVSEALYLRDPDETALNFTGTGRWNSGRAVGTASWPCSRDRWISTICCGRSNAREAPSSNTQAPEKFQTPKLQKRQRELLDYWCFSGAWSLMF
jgi:catechol 2,3-dioxygenase-like lactoylglutathione lyase family enzyme